MKRNQYHDYKTPRCVECLYSVGYPFNAISSQLRVSKTTVSNIVRRAGLITEETRMRNRRRKDAQRAAANAAKRALRPEKEKPIKPVFYGPYLTPQIKSILRSRAAMERYYSNVDEARAKSREAAKRSYARMKAPGLDASPSLIAKRLRSRLSVAVKHQATRKHGRTFDLLGCSLEFFMKYMQARMKEGMSWSNYGDWHIDHVIPCSSFDLTKKSEQAKCFHYTNLQPLWAFDNHSKHARVNEQLTMVGVG